MMNTLANHNYIPRNGSNITKATATQALGEALNFDEALASLMWEQAIIDNPEPHATFFTLCVGVCLFLYPALSFSHQSSLAILIHTNATATISTATTYSNMMPHSHVRMLTSATHPLFPLLSSLKQQNSGITTH